MNTAKLALEWIGKLQAVINSYLPPDGISQNQAMGEIIELLDGPYQRKMERLIGASQPDTLIITRKEIEGMKQDMFETIDKCCEILDKWGDGGSFTEKGKNEHGLEIMTDFAWALGVKIKLEIEELGND